MKTVLKAIWNALKSNLLMKIMAVLFAVILWSYVLSETNPDRTRVLTNIPVRYLNAASLTDKQLQVSESLSDVLDTASVKVMVKNSDIKLLSEKSIDAYVDLSIINGEGEKALDVDASISISGGVVLEINPKTVKVHVDKYVSKTIPVEVITTGSVPMGYYAGTPEIMPATIDIRGASTDVEKVASAVCNIGLTGLTKGFNKNMEIELLDYDGNVVDKAIFPNDLPSVIVKLNVQHMKTVPIDADGSIIGQDEVAAGYSVDGISCEPQSVGIAGDADALAKVTRISLAPYSVSGKSGSESVALDYLPPEGVTVLAAQKAQVTISIREITKTKTFDGVAIKARNLASGLRAQISEPKVDATVMAGASAMSRLSRSSVAPYVDLEGFGAGTYTFKVLFEIPRGFTEENFTASPGTVTVTIY